MPAPPDTPARTIIVRDPKAPALLRPEQPYVELGLSTCFSFLRATSTPLEYAEEAARLGYHALGIADGNTMAGVVQMHLNLEGLSIRPVIGCRIELVEGWRILAYPRDRNAYGRLCALLSKGKRHDHAGRWQDKGDCSLSVDDLADVAEGSFLALLPPDQLERFEFPLAQLCKRLPLTHLCASHLYRGDDRARINRLDRLARRNGLKLLAINDVHYHDRSLRDLQDVMTCIGLGLRIGEAGDKLHANAERHLKTPEEMVRLFDEWPNAIAETRRIADACTFSLKELRYEYPEEKYPESRNPQQQLHHLTRQGAYRRYPDGLPRKVKTALVRELKIIRQLDLARYFLTIESIVAFAEGLKPPILCQGRGSAANSAVCYCLRITAVDPTCTDLLFERFISPERGEPPDIDVDFEHERREEVIQHIYSKYGRDHAGLAATVIHYRPRSAIREVGKVMGLSEDVTASLARTVWGAWGEAVAADGVAEAGMDLTDPHLARTIELARRLVNRPRHLSQHVGGFILTERPLVETVPIGNGAMPERSFIEWDKDDIDALGIFKVDVLALGMLTCVRKAFDLIEAHHCEQWTLATVPNEDPAVYDMLCKGDSLGVFQVESRAQMNMLPRLKPRTWYDLVIEVAIVRPGPIQGDMVHPYLKRRAARRPIEFPKPAPEHGPPDELEKILKRTLGVPIFQEQAMQIALDAAKFSPEEANRLRKAMATFRDRGERVVDYEARMVDAMIGRGYDPEFARKCFDQIKGFGQYGFPESHAASFAHLVYVSSWIKCHYPAAFACALLNSQPMGFYAPAQIVRCAREHGVEVRAPDVNFSEWDNLLEPGAALRLGLRQVDGIGEDVAGQLLAARDRPFENVEDLRDRARLSVAAIRKLAAADAFRSMGLDRRQALWDSQAIKQAPALPLFNWAEARDEGAEPIRVDLPETPLAEHVVADYQTLRLSLKAHPMQFLRERLNARGFTPHGDLERIRPGRVIHVAGLVLVRQKPGSASGVCFITLEDETGVSNLVIWPSIFEKYRRAIMAGRLIEVRGRVQREESIIHVVVDHIEDATPTLAMLSDDLLRETLARADHVVKPLPQAAHKHPRNVTVIPKSRDFH